MTTEPADRRPAPEQASCAPARLRVEVFPDPVCEALGVDPRHPYFEFCYVPVIGPSSAWLLRRLVAGLARHPQGYELDLAQLSRDIGLGGRLSHNGSLTRSLGRLARFGLARFTDDHTYQVRTKLPPLTAGQLARLGPVPVSVHRQLLEERSAQRNPLLAAALAYGARGWPVFPLRPAGKVPEGSLVAHGLNDATCDPARIRAWWRASPAANVAIRTGEGLDVIDVDGPEGRAALEQHCPEVFTSAVAVATGRGLHLYFATSGLSSRAGVLPGVDVRGAGGYVVAPPSAHPGGQRYRFVDRSGAALAELPDTLRPVPASFLELSKPRRPEAPARDPVSLRAAVATYGKRALDDECAQVAATTEGRRNDRLNRAAFAMGTLVGAEALDARAAAARLLEAAQRAGLSEHEAMRTIASGLKAGIDHPRRLADTGARSGRELDPSAQSAAFARRRRERDAPRARSEGRSR